MVTFFSLFAAAFSCYYILFAIHSLVQCTQLKKQNYTFVKCSIDWKLKVIKNQFFSSFSNKKKEMCKIVDNNGDVEKKTANSFVKIIEIIMRTCCRRCATPQVNKFVTIWSLAGWLPLVRWIFCLLCRFAKSFLSSFTVIAEQFVFL